MNLASKDEIDKKIDLEEQRRFENQKTRNRMKQKIEEIKDLLNQQTAEEFPDKKKELEELQKELKNLHEKTEQQIEAIYDNGQNLLLAASAGSGKTFVMVERILDRIARGVRLSELFISTFTNLATAELKERLEVVIRKKLLQATNMEEKHLYHQALTDLPTADILTIDSFSGRLVREYYYLLDIDPNFRLLNDTTEIVNLKEKIFRELEEELLSGKNKIITKENFAKLIRNFSNDRSDIGLFEVINQIHTFAESNAEPIGWLETEMLKGYEKYKTFDQVPGNLVADLSDTLLDFADYLKIMLTEELIIFGKKDHETKINLLNIRVKKYEEAADLLLRKKPVEEILSNLIPINKTEDGKQLLTTRQIKDDYAKDVFVKKRGNFTKKEKRIVQIYQHRKTIEKFTNNFEILTKILQDFSLLFYQRFLQAKIQQGLLEYADINHFAIQLLKENVDILRFYREKYVEVMVDEYQDINRMQEKLLELLSNGDNRFMVGDIKQSIYGFRLADPNLFIDKQKKYQNVNEKEGKLIRLKENFRSHQEVINFTNVIFEHLFDETLTNMTYDEDEKLKFGNLALPSKTRASNYPELLIYHNDRSKKIIEEEEGIEAGEFEIIGSKIKELLKNGVQADEIAILVRNRSKNAEIESILDRYGIPVNLLDGKANYLQSIEIQVIFSTLRAINNPYSDIDLVALMRSPMFRFNEDELMRIRLQKQYAKFYEAVLKSLQPDAKNQKLIESPLRNKIESFLKVFNNWRDFRVTHSIYDLILKIYQEKYYLDFVGGLSRGKQRQANLQALLTRAKIFEQNGYKGLLLFIKLIDSYLEKSNDLEEVPTEKKDNAVQVLTIHKSKGLEFPYVFVVNLGKQINRKDLQNKVIITREVGVGIKAIVPHYQALIEMETIPYTVSKMVKERTLVAEEMRLLYVAFTRAEKKLFLTATVSSSKQLKTAFDENFGTASSKVFDKWRDKIDGNSGLLSDDLRLGNSIIDWIGGIIWSLENPDKDSFISDNLGVNVKIFTDEDIQLTNQNEKKASVSFDAFNLLTKSFDNEQDWINLARKAKNILDSSENYNQKNLSIIQMPTIQTPSTVKKRYEYFLENTLPKTTKEFLPTFDLEVPNFEQQFLTPTEIGNLLHEILQRIDFSNENILKSIKQAFADATCDITVDIDEILTKYRQKIVNFFTKDCLGQKIIHASKESRFFREQPFAMLVNASTVGDLDFTKEVYSVGEQHVLIKGVIDGYLLTDDEIIVIDYKTDRRVSRETLVQRYHKQLEVYAKALSESMKNTKKVRSFIIALGINDERVEVIEIKP
ncbi:MAG: helicase-exonuclease AddAB subunit AddA [Streptococcaceae bacterium]|jgi:ATP-dependent helicase/nuclease subunit A|nr:helicase-exonuclease AddAB subunit AddA [Streptococcaceae bacterium]